MASQVMDERRMSPSSYYHPEEISYPTERQVGFWEHETMLNHQGLGMDELLRTSGNKAIPSSQLEYLEIPQPYQKTMLNHAVGAERAANLSASWRSMDNDLVTKSKQFGQPTSYFAESNKVDMGSQYENGLLPSSISEMFGKKLKLSSNGVLFSQSVDAMASHHYDDEPFQSLEEIEAQTIGNLLPDDDDLLSGVNGDVDYILRPNSGDDVEDLDIFSSGGGMELEGDGGFNMSWIQRNLEFSGGISSGQQGGLKSSFVGEHPCGENPSRTLFVRNINSNVEDSELRALFEQYGDIRTLYTACKHRGFVMISYYDIRAASKAIGTLQNKPLRRRKLDIHFSIPKDVPSEKDINQGTLVVSNLDFSVSNHDLHRIFGVYGEIKEIREAGHISDHKFIEFYDVRAAEAALRALNKMDIAGKCIKLELSHAWSAKKCSMEQSLLELKHEESIPCLQPGSSPSNSLSGGFGSVSHGAITSSCADALGLNPVIGVPISRLMENGFQHGFSPSVPQNLASSAGGAPCGNQARLGMPNPSMGQMEFAFRQMPTFHPNSLPEYRDGLANGVPYNSPGTTIANTNPRPTEGFDNRHISGFGLNRNSIEPIEHSVFGSGNGSFPYHGPHHMWNPSNNPHRPHPPNHMMWLNSQSHVNGVHGHPSPQMHRLPRAPSHMLNVVPLHHHHVGSAPVVNPSLWDRRVAYSGESHDVGFHPGSLGSTGFSGSPTMHPLDLASHNIFPSAGGNCVDPLIASSKNVGLHSPQCQMFPRGNSMGNLTNSFDTPNERVRNRRIEINSYQVENKKQFELDIERILRKEDTRTTLMIKNIPNKYTSKMLLSAIDESNRGTYDFFYLPIDFKNKCNVGYAFINMVDPLQIVPFYQAFNGKKWEKFNSEKVVLLAYARIQGKAALVSHFQNSSLMTEDKRCRPILFHTDGPNAGDQEPFPVGTNILSRPSRTRTHSSDGNRHGSPSTSANGEQNATDSSSGSE